MNINRVDGGGNIDTLKLNGSGSTLDLTKIINTRIQDIEKIDITGPGSNTLILNLSDVLDASTSTNILTVYTKPKQLVLFLFYKTTPAPC
jgi:hypothetical protein